uniref:DNA-directed RNA polymerase subunit beta' n=1 Tax=Pediastrum angulosum TaxID=271408 RepID=A0A2U8GHS0_9CHLO|nr:beta subunit of RNA polymerase [Pediastrum angulosum]
MNTYSNLLKKEKISFQQNPITKSSSQFRLVFFQKEKYEFFFIRKKLENQISTSRSNHYSIICSATKKQINHFNDNSKLNNSFTLQKNKVDSAPRRFQIYNSTKSATFSRSFMERTQTKIQKEKKNYNLNFLKKLNCFNFLLKKNATNKWVNWVNDANFESFNKLGSMKRADANEQQQRSGEENLLNKNLYKTGYSKLHELKLVSVEIASPEKIKEWAEKVLPNGKVFGEVTNANTLHYKTFKPHKGGLFCERIFGPLKDFECACGVRSKPMELESYLNENQQKKHFFCTNCDVEYTWSVIRRYQLGYINLISPVSHIWFLKANPSYLSLLLDFRRSHLESIVYCTEAITLENLWKSSQMLGLDTSPSTLYSIWQKLLEEEKLLKRKHNEVNASSVKLNLFGSSVFSRSEEAKKPTSERADAKEPMREIESFLSSHSMPSALSLTHPQSAEPTEKSKERSERAFTSTSTKHTKLNEQMQRSQLLLLQQKRRLNLMYLYINNKDLFYKKNIMSDYIENSFYKTKILSNNQFYNYEKSYEKSLKLIYKKTFFQVLAFTNNTFLFSRSSQKIFFFKDLINKLDIYNSLSLASFHISSLDSQSEFGIEDSKTAESDRRANAKELLQREKNFVLSQSLISSLFGIYDYSHNNKLQKEDKKRKNFHLKNQIISNIYEKEIVQFKDNFLVFAESFFQIYFTKLYLKDKTLIMQISNNILQLFCEFFLFYCIQIQLNFYIKKNPLNNLPKIFSVRHSLVDSRSKFGSLPFAEQRSGSVARSASPKHRSEEDSKTAEEGARKSSTSNKNNQIFSHFFAERMQKKIKKGNYKILKVSSKIKKGINSVTGLFYYTGICLFKKQIKLNMFFQKNKKFHLKYPYDNEITYKINFSLLRGANAKKNNLFENVKLALNSIESFNTHHFTKSISHSTLSLIPNVQLGIRSLIRFGSQSERADEKKPKKEQEKQTNLLQILIQDIYHKNDILSIQKNRKNVSDILYLLYEFYKKEMVFYKETTEIEYKQDKTCSILSEIYSLSTSLNLFYIKNNKYKFSEIVKFNNLINYLYKLSSNKKYKLMKKYNIEDSKKADATACEEVKESMHKSKRTQKDKILKIQFENAINLTKNCSNLNFSLLCAQSEGGSSASPTARSSLREKPKHRTDVNAKKNTLNQRKRFLFLQKQKSLILRNPQFFSSIYSKKTSNSIYYSQSPKKKQYKEDWQSSLQKKMLKNDLYTISYSHLWSLNADWKSFFYYNSAPKDFEDTHIYYSYRKGSFYNKSNKFSTKLEIVSQIGFGLRSKKAFRGAAEQDIFVSDSMNENFRSRLGSSHLQPLQPFTSVLSLSAKLHGSAQSKPFASAEPKRSSGETTHSYEQRPKPKVAKTTEFLSKINSPLAGAAIVKKLLSEYTPAELKKMVKQHQVLLPKLNQNIRQLKEKATKKLDFVKIQKLLNKRDHIIRRLKLIRKFSRKNVDPTSMILSVLPVLPPDLRPILKLQNQIAASDLNRLYQRIIYRNERLKKFLKDPSTSQSFEMKYAQRLLQEAVDNLIQNGKGNVKPETNSRGQALKSLSEILKGKQGRFRQYLLGKRVDYSGRSVIVVGPKLKLYECGLPKEMAIELFLPFLIKRILHYKIARTVIGAKNFLYSNKTYCINLLNEIMRNHPVLLNRAPTLHRLGIQAFQPKLVEGRAILLHPLVCPAFNADFDGDQMAVHLPITVEARAEAWTLIFSRNHLISPATGDPIVLPSQDMVLGCYYLTSEKKNILASRLGGSVAFDSSAKPTSERADAHRIDAKIANSDKKYKNLFCISNLFNLEKVLNAYQLGKISVQSIVWIKWNGKTQFANEPLSIIEIRLNRYGIRDQIHSKSYKRIDKKENLLNQYIRTTPGRILINNIAQKCMFL